MIKSEQQNFFGLLSTNSENIISLDPETEKIKELINRRRRQILVHSCLYYRMNTTIITDKQFDKWAYQLVDLQKEYPQIANNCVFAEDFTAFDGTTGFDLPLDNNWVVSIAYSLIR